MRFTASLMVCVLMTATALVGQAPQSRPSVGFGLAMGSPKKSVGLIAGEVGTYKYLLVSVPKPHPDLEIYYVTVTPKSGVCAVRANSLDFKTTPTGTALQSRFTRLRMDLEAVHGKPDVLDQLFNRNLPNEPTQFMTTLLKKQRALFAAWPREKEQMPASSSLSRVTVNAIARSETDGYVAVQYYFRNYEQCQAEIAEQDARPQSGANPAAPAVRGSRAGQ